MRDKEKSVVIVMDEDKFEAQKVPLFNFRKTCIHVYDGDLISEIERQKQYKDAAKADWHDMKKERDRLKKTINQALGAQMWGDRENALDRVVDILIRGVEDE